MAAGILQMSGNTGGGFKRTVLRKENVFTCVTFGALLLFVIAESFFNPDNLATTAFLIAVSVFVLSLLRLLADVAEDINDQLTSFLKGSERYLGYSSEKLRMLKQSSEADAETIIEELTAGVDNNGRKKPT